MEVGVEVVCLSSGAKVEHASAHRFFERHPRVQGSSYPGDKRVFGMSIERLAFQIERDTRAVLSDFDIDRSTTSFVPWRKAACFLEERGVRVLLARFRLSVGAILAVSGSRTVPFNTMCSFTNPSRQHRLLCSHMATLLS